MSEGRRGNALVFMVTALVATEVARRVTDVVWTAATGDDSPDNVDDPGHDLKPAIAFALLSGATAGVIRMLINRQTRRFLGD